MARDMASSMAPATPGRAAGSSTRFTVSVQIVTLLTGDQEFNSPKTLSAFGLGLTLFLVTLVLNIVAQRIVQTYRQQYD